MPVTEIIAGALYQCDENSVVCERLVVEQGKRRVLLVDLCGIDDEAIPRMPEVTYVRWPIDDGPLPDVRVLAALEVLAANFIAADGVVVAMCSMGMNRSGLLAAGIVARVQGLSGPEAARLVRSKNAQALSNPVFLRYLCEER